MTLEESAAYIPDHPASIVFEPGPGRNPLEERLEDEAATGRPRCIGCGRFLWYARRRLVDEQLSIRWMAEEDHGRSLRARVESIGWDLAERRARRTALEHLQGHLRFETIDSKRG